MSQLSSVLALILQLIPGWQHPAAPPASSPRLTESVIVTATVAPLPADSVARTVATVSRRDLEDLGVTSIAEALRLIPGLDPRARGGRGVQTDFSIRGATFGQSLVLVDGVRLNDSQSGHHNGDIPIAVAGVDRIEVVNGGSSSVHGADALGGAINVISRADRHVSMLASAGQFGTVDGQFSASGRLLPEHWLSTSWASRSGGFTTDREYALGGSVLRGQVAPGWTVDLRHERKAFGANGFYGNSPSKEWTDQTVVAGTWRREGTWSREVVTSFRRHADHFRWDINRPGFAENQHRTHAAQAGFVVQRLFASGRRLSVGGGAGGDWVASSNLGDHRYGRVSAFAEWHMPVANRTAIQLGTRVDRYSSVGDATGGGAGETRTGFGGAWSPSAAIGTRLARDLRARVSVARAFRVPTFTELYYHDPANLGSPDLRAEDGWSLDGGLDWSPAGWTVSVSPFRRWDTDVIDWVKSAPADLWRSTNVRDVTTTGVEASVSRRWRASLVRASYTALAVEAPSLDLISKYVREYARHSVNLAWVAPVGGGVRAAINLDYRNRVDGQSYLLAGLRISRTVRRADLFVEGTNLGNEPYREIAGVEMPGRWVMAGVLVR